MKPGVLYIDDEHENLTSFNALFRGCYKIFTASSAIKGGLMLDEHQDEIHLIITDQRMPGMTGTEFLSSIINKYPDPIRILTGSPDIQTIIDAINRGLIYQYLTKPWNEQELTSVIQKAYDLYISREEKRRQLKELTVANSQLEFLLRQKLLS